MFMRLVQMSVDPERIVEFEKVYRGTIIPALQRTPGCVYAALVRSVEDENEGISITFWNRQEDALAYERSGKYGELVEAARPFFSDSSDWKVQLSDDLRLEFGAVAPEPVVTSYSADVPSPGVSGLPGAGSGSLTLRIVALKIKPEKKQEFVEIYRREIIPGVRRVEGCLDVYLAEGVRGENELLSVTVWSELQQAKAYEATGEFDRLREKVEHTFSNLARWKIALDDALLPGARGMASKAVTSDDVTVRTYTLVLGKALR